MRKQKGSISEEVLFGELVHLSHQSRSVGYHRATPTPGMIRSQRGPGLARNRRLPQYGNNKTNANRVLPCAAPSFAVACGASMIESCAGSRPCPSALLGDGGGVSVSHRTVAGNELRYFR